MDNTITPESAGVCGQSANSADNMRTRNAYGEPWKPLQPDLIYDSCSYWMADAFNPEVRDRIISCVNACAGMADPAAHITAMREAIREAHKIIQVLYMDALDNHKESWPRANEWMDKHAAFATKEP